VSSVVYEVITLIENAVTVSVPLLVKSRNYYDFNKNDGARNAYIYAVRPASASSVSGVIRSATIEQEFEVELSKEFVDTGSTDQSIRDAIEAIYLDNELILKEITLRRSGNILKVGEPSYSAPEINQNQKSVSITFTYPITYRKSIRGAI
jgi:hypothetical protein